MNAAEPGPAAEPTSPPASDPCRPRVLFLCTGNSCRSHMAEGWLRHLHGDRFEAVSAGTDPAGYVHPRAVAVMAEAGVDLSGHASKTLDSLLPPHGAMPAEVVAVCSSAAKSCPTPPSGPVFVAVPFDDPADASGTDEEIDAVFRRVRDELRAMVEERYGR